MVSRPLLKWSFTGFFAGYVIVHPAFMGLGHLMHQENLYADHTFWGMLVASFSGQMLPWGLTIASGCGLIGYLLKKNRLNENLLKKSKAELENRVNERTRELAKANQDLKAEIVEHKKAEDEIHYLAYYDSLTTLPNQHFFKDFLKKSIAYANRYNQKFAVFLLDLDDFNRINNTFGHKIGDNCLKMIAGKLATIFRNSDHLARIDPTETTIARMGGDEFIVLLHKMDEGWNAAYVARRVLDEISKAHEVDGHEVFINASVGISLYPDNGKDADVIIKNADMALFNAKKCGKNSYQFYSESMNEKTLKVITIENNLRRAIENQEFMLHYQPKADTATMKPAGLEALIRWQPNGEDFISPGEFIPLAEKNGMIVPIGNFVLNAACVQNKQWQDAGLEKTRIAVNVSGVQFGQDNFVENVLKILKNTGVSPEYLELEITETTIMVKDRKSVV